MKLRIGLTSTADRGTSLLPLAGEFGLEGVVLPCINVNMISGGAGAFAAAIDGAEVVVFTSARAVRLLDPLDVSAVDVLVVGPETAAAVEAAGGSVAWVGSQGVGQLISEAGHLIEGRRVVVAGAQNTAEATTQAFADAGVRVEWVSLYATIPVAPPSGDIDAVVFGSPTAVSGWLMARELSGVLVGAIGHTTASALRRHGVEPDAIPDFPTYASALESLAAISIERTEK